MLVPGQKLNLKRLTKVQIIWLWEHHCEAHGHRYLEHPQCIFKEQPSINDERLVERIGFLDIEAGGLVATFNYIFSYCIKEFEGNIIERVVTPKEIRSYDFDKKLMQQFCMDIQKFDRLIVYWGKSYRFDIPFLRTRAVKWGLDFPKYQEKYVTDVFDTVKSKLRLHRNRLETACEFLDIPCKQHRLNPNIWQKALAGDKVSLDWILEHNREDVISLEELWKRLNQFSRHSRISI